jgi:hypothetical protein
MSAPFVFIFPWKPASFFFVGKPQIYLKRNRSYKGLAISRRRFLSAKTRIRYQGGLCGIRGGVAPGQSFLTFGFPLSVWFHQCSTFMFIYHRHCVDLGSDRVAESATNEWNVERLQERFDLRLIESILKINNKKF